MSEKILQQILTEMKEMKSDMTSMKSQLDENTEILKSVHDRQEETDAKLESLTIDVHQMRGELTSLKQTVDTIKDQLDFTSHKTFQNEMEIFKLRRNNIDFTESSKS